MPQRVRKQSCVMFVRSEAEKKMWKAAQGFEKQEKKIEDLEKKIAMLESLVSKENSDVSESSEEINTQDNVEVEAPKKRKRSSKTS